MSTCESTNSPRIHRRVILKAGLASLPAMAWHSLSARPGTALPEKKKPTQFQIACMTLPYAQFPLERALTGIKSAGYSYVAWGTTHRERDGKEVPVVAPDAPPARAKDLAARCRDLGLAPLMMFSGVYPEAKDAVEILTSRLRQAAAAGVPHVLTFGHTGGSDRRLWIERFKQLGPIARDQGVMIVIKQHGGNTGTGAACAEIVREVADEGVRVNYDAGNVMDYLDVDPIADIQKCAEEIRSFCIKDHRNFPADEDCGPGLGEIDHYKLLHTVAFTGLKMPLCCENIFAPVIPRPTDPAGVDALARRAREFLEIVIAGLQA
ncbi:MAG: family glycosyltransferase [Acidobacteria bacterium]|nr:family glycosyltransferase [Acidobacteriota bacterium]